jgi:hypothetical protein
MPFRFKWLIIGYLGSNHFLSYVMLSYHSAELNWLKDSVKKIAMIILKKSTIYKSKFHNQVTIYIYYI